MGKKKTQRNNKTNKKPTSHKGGSTCCRLYSKAMNDDGNTQKSQSCFPRLIFTQ